MAPPKYYAVRKGRCPGVYDNWNDCKRQVDGYVGNQYKSFTSLKEAQDYVAENTHAPQPSFFKQIGNNREEAQQTGRHRSATNLAAAAELENFVPTVFSATEFLQIPTNFKGERAQGVYLLEFDGASKGNPGRAGAGAVLRNPDGSVLCRVMEGVGVATNNVAEYRAIIRGLKVCLSEGIDHIHVRGDSNLVCMQIQDKWQTRNANIADLSKEAKELKSKFKEFRIDHVLREYNSDADAVANEAISLPDGEWRMLRG